MKKEKKIKYYTYILDIIQYCLKTAERSTLRAPFPFDLRWNKFIQFNYAAESLLSQSTWLLVQIPKPLTDFEVLSTFGYSFYPFISLFAVICMQLLRKNTRCS